jgi:sec-independent protein translocase protein TatC
MGSKLATTDQKKLQTPNPPTEEPPEDPEGGVMGFWEHIEELRDRTVKVVISVVIGMVIAAFFTNPVIAAMKASYGRELVLIGPTDAIVIFFRVALTLGAIIASPIITYHIFMFIIPGLTSRERRWVFLALPGTTILFMIGLAFAWFALIPTYVNFLTNFQADLFEPFYTADAYISFVTNVLIWHAAAFETPLIFYVLARGGFITAGVMLKYWRQAIIGAAVLAALITPTVDPVTMSVIMGILMALYVISIGLVFFAQRRYRRATGG